VRHGARWALGVGASLTAIAAVGGARADVRYIDLDNCSTVCLPSASDDAAAAGDESAADVTLFGGGGTEGANDGRPDLILDPRALPPVLVSGLPSPIADVAAQTLDNPGVSPYAFFAQVIDPRSAATRAAPFFLFTAPLTSQLLWASNDFFGPPPGDIASRRAVPIPADADALYGALYDGLHSGPRMMQTRATPTLSPSPLSGPPSSDAAQPFGQVGDEAGRSAEVSSDGAESNK
jgi:hypothetical protein